MTYVLSGSAGKNATGKEQTQTDDCYWRAYEVRSRRLLHTHVWWTVPIATAAEPQTAQACQMHVDIQSSVKERHENKSHANYNAAVPQVSMHMLKIGNSNWEVIGLGSTTNFA